MYTVIVKTRMVCHALLVQENKDRNGSYVIEINSVFMKNLIKMVISGS